MPKLKSKHVCQECGYESPKWLGKCPGCQSWNSFVEELETAGAVKTRGMSASANGMKEKPTSIIHIESGQDSRIVTHLPELNRVLGGGVVPGSLILVGGDPGIGKSTLLLQTSYTMTMDERKVLYISGEESVRQTKMRADRLGALSERLYVLCFPIGLLFLQDLWKSLLA